MIGGIAFTLLSKSIDYVKSRFSGGGGSAAWGIYFGVAIDLFSDGIMIGTGSTVGTSLGLLLALGQVPADIPEGFATIATFKNKGVSKKLRYTLAVAFAVPILLGATLGYWAVRDSSKIVKYSLLAFTAGILLTVSIEERLQKPMIDLILPLPLLFYHSGLPFLLFYQFIWKAEILGIVFKVRFVAVQVSKILND